MEIKKKVKKRQKMGPYGRSKCIREERWRVKVRVFLCV